MFAEQDAPEAELIGRWNRVFRALAAEPRRQVVCSLLEAPPERSLSLPQAANPPNLLADPEQLAVDLVHTHLPVLAEGGFVEWSREPLTVERGPNFEEVAAAIGAIWDDAEALPSQLVDGCQRLEQRREGTET